MKISGIMYAAGLGSILMSLITYLRGKSESGDNNERNGLFFGLWAPTFFAIGQVLEDREARGDDQPLHL